MAAEVELPDEALDEVLSEYRIDQHLADPDAMHVDQGMTLPRFGAGVPTFAMASKLAVMSSVSEVDALAASGRGYSEQLIERNPRQTRSSSLTWPIRQAPSGESPALPPGHAALASDGPSLAGADSAGAPGP